MARIRASCPTCGDVELTTAEMAVRVNGPDGSGEYRFVCPVCASPVEKLAERHTVDLLLASGVHEVGDDEPVESIVSAESRPLTHDDLLEFHELLCDEDQLSQAVAQLASDTGL